MCAHVAHFLLLTIPSFKQVPTVLIPARVLPGIEHLGISTFIAKISESNAASLALFVGRLGFAECKRIAAFGEVHLVCGPAQGLRQRVMARTDPGRYREVGFSWGAASAR